MTLDRLHLIAAIAGQRVAIPAGAIESVVEVESLAPVPLAPPHLAGLFALRSRVLTVIDSVAALSLPDGGGGGSRPAVVVVVDGHLYGLLVDRVDEVVSLPGDPQPLAGTYAPGWMRAAHGLVEHEGEALLVMDPAALIAGPAAAAA